jgi:hypothetical protein
MNAIGPFDVARAGHAGHLAECARESAVVIISALLRVGIESFSVITFGNEVLSLSARAKRSCDTDAEVCSRQVTIIKTEEEEFDGLSKLLLLQQFDKVDKLMTRDADAVTVCTDLLRRSPVRGPKKAFVFSDGFGAPAQCSCIRSDQRRYNGSAPDASSHGR